MARIEKGIEAARQEQWDEAQRLLEDHRRLRSLRATLQEAPTPDAPLDVESASREIAAQRRALSRSRQGLALATTALLHDADGASPPDPRVSAALGVLQASHRHRLDAAARRILTLEAQHGGAATPSVAEIRPDPTLALLRARHARLAEDVARLQNDLDRRAGRVRQLTHRRKRIEDLIARLARGESVQRHTTGSVTLAPVLRRTATTTPRPPAIRPERSETLAESWRCEGGTRWTLWRASPLTVRAPAPGRVVFDAPFAGWRRLMILDHGGGWRTLYGNLSETFVREGEAVGRWQTLGDYRAGDADRAEALWFEVRQGVTPMRPAQWPEMPMDWRGRLATNAQ